MVADTRFLTLDEVTVELGLLGIKAHYETIRNWILRGKLKAVRIVGRVYVEVSELLRFIRSQEITASVKRLKRRVRRRKGKSPERKQLEAMWDAESETRPSRTEALISGTQEVQTVPA